MLYTHDSSKSSTNPLQKAISSKITGRKEEQNVENSDLWLLLHA
jgi:hypothetical protein